METTIIKKVKGSTMESIFNDHSNICNVRYYTALNLKDEESYNPDKTYRYEIRIRHSEESTAERDFMLALNKCN